VGRNYEKLAELIHGRVPDEETARNIIGVWGKDKRRLLVSIEAEYGFSFLFHGRISNVGRFNEQEKFSVAITDEAYASGKAARPMGGLTVNLVGARYIFGLGATLGEQGKEVEEWLMVFPDTKEFAGQLIIHNLKE
jgi:hypothetical protein